MLVQVVVTCRSDTPARERVSGRIKADGLKAWSNANLSRLAEKIRSPLVFAHVRASTMAGARKLLHIYSWSGHKELMTDS